MAAQICETCKKKGARCYCPPNSTCESYEPRTLTQFEQLKLMSFDEMVECSDICPYEYVVIGKYCDTANCQLCRKLWLESEAK